MQEKKLVTFAYPVQFKFSMNDVVATGLSFNGFMLCYLISKGNMAQLIHYSQSINLDLAPIIDEAILKGMLIYTGQNPNHKKLIYISLTDNFKRIIGGGEPIVDNWIDDWLELWPKGLKSGGYYIRGNKKIVMGKMKRFLMDFPEFSKKTIFEATNKYLQAMANDGFKYCKLSHYFIYKESDSTLASECSAIIDEENNPLISPEDVFGESEL